MFTKCWNFPCTWQFSNVQFFCTNMLLFCQKSAKFSINCKNINMADIFLNAQLFSINTLLFNWILPKFVTNYPNIPHGWCFWIQDFFCPNRLLFHQKLAKIATNCQNKNFSHDRYFFKYTKFMHKLHCYFAKKIGKICDFCCQVLTFQIRCGDKKLVWLESLTLHYQWQL